MSPSNTQSVGSVITDFSKKKELHTHERRKRGEERKAVVQGGPLTLPKKGIVLRGDRVGGMQGRADREERKSAEKTRKSAFNKVLVAASNPR